MLLGALTQNGKLGDCARWIAAAPEPAAREIRDFLELCVANVASNKQKKLLESVRSADEDGADSLLYEVVAHELLRRLHLDPEFWPKLDSGLTPDMIIRAAKQEFIVDVFLTRNPSRTNRPILRTVASVPKELRDLPMKYTVDAGDRAKKIGERILEKYRKYARTGKPMVLVAFLGDYHMQMLDVECALYGASLQDGRLRDDFPKAIMRFRNEFAAMNIGRAPAPGVLLPDESNRPGCPRLSAVLACYWFDSVDRNDPGRLMQCKVLHHWKPDVPIPSGAFGQFPEVAWTAKSSGSYEHNIVNLPTAVARFTGTDEFEFRDHS
jgi:hypothetical protein